MNPILFLKNFEQKVAGERKGTIYFVVSGTCLILAAILPLSSLYYAQELVRFYFSHVTKPLDNFPADSFSLEYIEDRIVFVLEIIKWQVCIFGLVFLKNLLLVVNKGWSFILSALVSFATFALFLVYCNWAIEPESNLYDPRPDWVLGIFSTVLLILSVSDFLILVILLFKKKKRLIKPK